MISRINVIGLLTAGLLIMSTSAVQAVPVLVTNPGDLAPGPYTIHDFETEAGGPGASYSSTTGVRQATSASFSDNVTPSGLFGLSTNEFPDPITIVFDNATSSAGMWFGNDDTCCSDVFTAWLDIFDASGLIASLGVVANMNDGADQFIGFNSDNLVTMVTIRYGSGSDVGLYHYIDDVYFNVASVPEPGTLALLGIGLLGLGLSRRKKV